MKLHNKYQQLQDLLRDMGKVLVAYSGGVDSTFLMKAAHDVLGNNALAVLASSNLYPDSELQSAIDYANQAGFDLINIRIDELQNPHFTSNPPDRCYYCKRDMLLRLKQIAANHGIQWVLHGANADDKGDFRPGQLAADELGVRAPLQELGFTKAEIRELSQELGLPTWNKPSFACLATRFPYGSEITHDGLAMVARAEEVLRGLGLGQFRVRHHGSIARIEVEVSTMPKLIEKSTRGQILSEFKKIGYLYVTMDIEGYRTGSMNETLKASIKTDHGV